VLPQSHSSVSAARYYRRGEGRQDRSRLAVLMRVPVAAFSKVAFEDEQDGSRFEMPTFLRQRPRPECAYVPLAFRGVEPAFGCFRRWLVCGRACGNRAF